MSHILCKGSCSGVQYVFSNNRRTSIIFACGGQNAFYNLMLTGLLKHLLASSFFIILSLLIWIPLGWPPPVKKECSLQQELQGVIEYGNNFCIIDRNLIVYIDHASSCASPWFGFMFGYITNVFAALVSPFRRHMLCWLLAILLDMSRTEDPRIQANLSCTAR